MQQLSGQDASLLCFEAPNVPMHIGALQIAPPRPGDWPPLCTRVARLHARRDLEPFAELPSRERRWYPDGAPNAREPLRRRARAPLVLGKVALGVVPEAG